MSKTTTGIQAPRADGSNAVTILRQLKETMEVGQRLRGDPGRSFVTLQELIDAGVVRYAANKVQPPGLYVVFEPTSLTAVGIGTGIHFTFGAPSNVVPGVQYELLEDTSSTGLTNATVVWTGSAQSFTLPKSDQVTRYYWIRTVLPTGQRSFAYPASSANPSAAGIAGTAGNLGSINGTLDNIPNGTVSVKVNATATDGGGNVDLSQTGVVNKNLANVADAPSRYAVTNMANGKAVASVDPNNLALIDFTQAGHSGKSLANIPDDATSQRYAVLAVDGNRRALVDLSQAHLNKTLSNIADDSTYAKTRAGVLNNGVLAFAPTGKNLIQNPGFEVNNLGTSSNTAYTTVGQYLIDGWVIGQCDSWTGGNFQALWNSASVYAPGVHGGNYSVRLVCTQTASTLAANITYGARLFSNRIPVRYGEVVLAGGYAQSAANLSLPAGVSVVTRIGVAFYTYTGALISENFAMESGTQTFGTTFGIGAWQVPSNAAYCILEVCNFVINSNASTVNLAAGTLHDCSFDDVFINIKVDSDNELMDGQTYLRMPTPPAASAASQTAMTQSGTTTTINVGAGTYYLGGHTINVGSGSVAPSTYGTWYVYFDLPDLTSTSVTPTYQASSTPLAVTQSGYRVYVGQIGTSSSGGGTGGGTSGCFSGDTRVLTTEGWKRFDELPEHFRIANRAGCFDAKLLVHENNDEPLCQMGDGFVTCGHLFKIGGGWVPASQLFHERVSMPPRTVYNMEVQTDRYDDRHYILHNGLTAHNAKA